MYNIFTAHFLSATVGYPAWIQLTDLTDINRTPRVAACRGHGGLVAWILDETIGTIGMMGRGNGMVGMGGGIWTSFRSSVLLVNTCEILKLCAILWVRKLLTGKSMFVDLMWPVFEFSTVFLFLCTELDNCSLWATLYFALDHLWYQDMSTSCQVMKDMKGCSYGMFR